MPAEEAREIGSRSAQASRAPLGPIGNHCSANGEWRMANGERQAANGELVNHDERIIIIFIAHSKPGLVHCSRLLFLFSPRCG